MRTSVRSMYIKLQCAYIGLCHFIQVGDHLQVVKQFPRLNIAGKYLIDGECLGFHHEGVLGSQSMADRFHPLYIFMKWYGTRRVWGNRRGELRDILILIPTDSRDGRTPRSGKGGRKLEPIG